MCKDLALGKVMGLSVQLRPKKKNGSANSREEFMHWRSVPHLKKSTSYMQEIHDIQPLEKKLRSDGR